MDKSINNLLLLLLLKLIRLLQGPRFAMPAGSLPGTQININLFGGFK